MARSEDKQRFSKIVYCAFQQKFTTRHGSCLLCWILSLPGNTCFITQGILSTDEYSFKTKLFGLWEFTSLLQKCVLSTKAWGKNTIRIYTHLNHFETEFPFKGTISHLKIVRAQELCESRGSHPGLPIPNSPYSLCGHKATLNWTVQSSEALSLISHTVSVDVKHRWISQKCCVKQVEEIEIKTWNQGFCFKKLSWCYVNCEFCQ